MRQTAWVRNSIGRFVLAKLKTEGITPSPQADKITLIPRLSFDLICLPPTPEQVDDNDPSFLVAYMPLDFGNKPVSRLMPRQWNTLRRAARSLAASATVCAAPAGRRAAKRTFCKG